MIQTHFPTKNSYLLSSTSKRKNLAKKSSALFLYVFNKIRKIVKITVSTEGLLKVKKMDISVVFITYETKIRQYCQVLTLTIFSLIISNMEGKRFYTNSFGMKTLQHIRKNERRAEISTINFHFNEFHFSDSPMALETAS